MSYVRSFMFLWGAFNGANPLHYPRDTFGILYTLILNRILLEL